MQGECVQLILRLLVHFKVLSRRLFVFYLENSDMFSLLQNIVSHQLFQGVMASSHTQVVFKLVLLLLILL